MSDLRAMQRLCGLMRKAVQDYEMIAPGDRVMVGVSGGKDSVALTIGLSMLRKYIGFDYEVVAVTLDPQFDHQPMDYSALAELFREHGIPYEVRRTEIGPVVFEYRKEKNPCALCAKLRRGALHTAAQELGCNKVALGHHLDDAVETFYMNLWREGRIGCFSPVTYLSRRDLTLIRPMLLATEHEVRCAVKEKDFPIVKSRCPADGVTVREQTKDFVRERCRTDHAFRQKTLHALRILIEKKLRLRQLPAHVGGVFLPVACRNKGVRLQVSLQPKLHQAVQIGGLIGSNHSRFVPFFEIGAHRPKHRTMPNKF